MSYTVNGILGVVAVVATFGAVQFASGHDLTVGMRSSDTPLQEEVNRTVKADRAAVVAAMPAQARTISIRLERLPNTSIVVRLPAARDALSSSSPASAQPPSPASPWSAC